MIKSWIEIEMQKLKADIPGLRLFPSLCSPYFLKGLTLSQNSRFATSCKATEDVTWKLFSNVYLTLKSTPLTLKKSWKLFIAAVKLLKNLRNPEKLQLKRISTLINLSFYIVFRYTHILLSFNDTRINEYMWYILI